MPVYIDSIKFTDDYTGLPSGNGADTGVPYLMGCVGDLIYATINCRVAWNALGVTCTFSTANKTITLEYCRTFLTVTGTKKVDNSFAGLGFKVGDTIVVVGTTAGIDDGTYTIKSMTDTVITVNEAIPADGVFANINIYGTTTINALDFYYNQQPENFNGSKFQSLTDLKAVQKFTGFKGLYSANFNLTPNATSQAWWDKLVDGISCVPAVTDNGVDGSYNHNYTIVFPFLITPFFLSNQLSLLQNALAQGNSASLNGSTFNQPDYFTNNCLQFLCQIDARFIIGSQIADHSSQDTFTPLQGNTAWYNTFFPSGIKQGAALLTSAQYDLISCTYIDYLNNPATTIDVNNPTKVKLKISGGTSWDAAPYVLNFMWLPTNIGEPQGYSQKNQADFRKVFLHDRCKTTVGHASVNGDQFGTPLQAITGVTTTVYNYGLDVEIDFTIDLGSLSKSTLNADTQRNYLIWVTPQDPSITTLNTSNRNAVIGDVNQAFVNTDDPSLLTIITDETSDVHFFNYPDTNTNFLTDYKNWNGEYGLAKCQFLLSKGTILNSFKVSVDVVIKSIPPAFDVPSVTVAFFNLESWTKQTASLFDGTINQIEINETRGFQLPEGDLRNTRSVNRTESLDLIYGSAYAYTLFYGFQLGYKFWQNLPQFAEQYSQYPVNYWSVFTQMFAGNNRYNELAIAQGFTSKIKFRIYWEVLDIATGVITEFISNTNIASYDEGSQIGTNSILIDTTDLLGNTLNGVLPNNIPFYAVATFTGDSLVAPMGYTAVGELSLYYNNGGKTTYDRIMSDDADIETSSSVWTAPAQLIYNFDNTQATLIAPLDLTLNPLKNATIYAKIIFKKN